MELLLALQSVTETDLHSDSQKECNSGAMKDLRKVTVKDDHWEIMLAVMMVTP